MGLVSTWLNGIGLSYAWPSFDAAGIVTPAALANLDVTMFASLGVTDPEHRRKLFYLVQRIKLSIVEDDNDGQEIDNVATTVDRVLAATTFQSASMTSRSDEEENDINERDEEDEDDKDHVERRRAMTSKSSRTVSSKRDEKISSLPVQKTPSTNDSTRNTNPDTAATRQVSMRSSGMTKPSAGRNRTSLQAPSATRARTKNGSLAASVRKTNQREEEAEVNILEKHDIETDNNRYIEDDHGIVDSTKQDDVQKDDGVADCAPSNSSSTTTNSDSIASRTRSARSRQAKKLSPPHRRQESTKSRLKTPSSASSSRIAQPKPSRTGKALSTIPSNGILPMSPLMDLPRTNNLDNSPDEERKPTIDIKKNSINDSLTAVDGDSNFASNLNDLSDSERSDRSERSARSSRSVSSKTSVGSKHRRRTGGRVTKTQDEDRRKSAFSKFPTMDEEDERPGSFRSQIEILREENNSIHNYSTGLNDDEEEDMRIRVVVRKRPMSNQEASVAAGDVDVIHPFDCGVHGKLFVYQPRTRVDLTKQIETVPFCFDNVFGEGSTNCQIYERSVRNLIPPFFEGQWGCVFAYGQTGSGKTFTMMGSNMTTNNGRYQDRNNLGMYYMAALDIFQALNSEGFEGFSVSVSLFEIYGGKLFDLLNARNQVKCLEDHKGRVQFPGLSEHPLRNADDLIAIIEEGGNNRSTGSTSRNADSSRSHAILQLHLHNPLQNRSSVKKKAEFSRLTFIDLAGSERGADTSTSSRETRMEGAEINTSLLALKEVIRALATGDSMTHVPFRGSKLTQVLKESFVGTNCRSVMIACISPNIGNCEQTLNTLRYANRVKERDPETGQVSGFVKATQRPGDISDARLSGTKSLKKSLENLNDGNETLERENLDPIDPAIFENSKMKARKSFDEQDGESCTSNMLDELLGESQDPGPIGQAAQQVILTHKDAMSTLLGMVKEEMTLVNQPARAGGMEDYILIVNALHERQLNMFALLRERIQTYRSLRESGGSHYSEDSGSIEDLRD